MFDYETFRVNIILLRKEFRMSQEDLAEKANLSVNNISKIERGEQLPLTKSVVGILNAFNMPLSTFMNYKIESNKEIIDYVDNILKNFHDDEKRFILEYVKALHKEV